MMIAVRGHYHWAHKMQNWFENIPTQEEMLHFRGLIESLVEMIPDLPEHNWPRTYLRMQIDRSYCMLGLRFWQLDQYKGTNCHSEVLKWAYIHRSILFIFTHADSVQNRSIIPLALFLTFDHILLQLVCSWSRTAYSRIYYSPHAHLYMRGYPHRGNPKPHPHGYHSTHSH